MEKAIITSSGEEDAGISSAESNVEIDIDFDGDKNLREDTREILRKAFDEIHDCGRTQVMFDDENYP